MKVPKVFITSAVWGEYYTSLFLEYSLASLLSENNLPSLSRDHEVALHVVTSRRDAKRLAAHKNFRAAEEYCSVKISYIDYIPIRIRKIPSEEDSGKYHFLSTLQNIGIYLSLKYDALVFNYADFIWADGSLSKTIRSLDADCDAVLGFCLPVDRAKGIDELDKIHAANDGARCLQLLPREAARIAMTCLEQEAQLRFWDGEAFSRMPTYLLWRVPDEGLIVRAYHQTILAVRPQPESRIYRRGIVKGTLDQHFSSVLPQIGARIRHATDSDEVMVFSLYASQTDTTVEADARIDWLVKCLQNHVSPEQFAFAREAIFVKALHKDVQKWADVERASLEDILLVHDLVNELAAAKQQPRKAITLSRVMQELAAKTKAFTLSGAMRGMLRWYLDSRLALPTKKMVGSKLARSLRVSYEGFAERLSERRER